MTSSRLYYFDEFLFGNVVEAGTEVAPRQAEVILISRIIFDSKIKK